MAKARMKTMILDNDRKAHSKVCIDAWAKHGIKVRPPPTSTFHFFEVYPGAGLVHDRTAIPEWTGKTQDDQGGFPVNSPDAMIWDYSCNAAYKSIKGGLYSKYKARKPSRRTNGGFVNEVKKSWKNFRQRTIRNAIDAQPKIMQAMIQAEGGPTKYMNTNCKV